MSGVKEAEARYRKFTGKLAVIYGLEPKERYLCSLVKTVPFQDMEVEMDLMLEERNDF